MKGHQYRFEEKKMILEDYSLKRRKKTLLLLLPLTLRLKNFGFFGFLNFFPEFDFQSFLEMEKLLQCCPHNSQKIDWSSVSEWRLVSFLFWVTFLNIFLF